MRLRVWARLAHRQHQKCRRRPPPTSACGSPAARRDDDRTNGPRDAQPLPAVRGGGNIVKIELLQAALGLATATLDAFDGNVLHQMCQDSGPITGTSADPAPVKWALDSAAGHPRHHIRLEMVWPEPTGSAVFS